MDQIHAPYTPAFPIPFLLAPLFFIRVRSMTCLPIQVGPTNTSSACPLAGSIWIRPKENPHPCPLPPFDPGSRFLITSSNLFSPLDRFWSKSRASGEIHGVGMVPRQSRKSRI
ncbi:hypothetical protein IE53DRAFT_388416 [Violaceomyces palustris]|uniref:Uncharacterized protein n=1 Tax=Violaceomyces palustris TaxID=1673888 RepID=A0ACD0NUF8_9BASI|nr:hypothetical protein IE53DRAFT_388416 [Violaceomyces palustris]